MVSERLIILVAPTHDDQFEEVVAACIAVGLQDAQPLPVARAIRGSADLTQQISLQEVTGVAVVEPARLLEINMAVEQQAQPRFAEVVAQCEARGLQVKQQLKIAGVVSGTIETALLPSLQQVAGIAAIEKSRDITLPPPDSPVQ